MSADCYESNPFVVLRQNCIGFLIVVRRCRHGIVGRLPKAILIFKANQQAISFAIGSSTRLRRYPQA